jgi:hypothetical protein
VPKNPVLQLLICGAVVLWGLYDLFAPGEAQAGAVIALHWIAVVLGSLGAIGAIYQLATGTPRGVKEK